jgi:CBS domain-containing protein
MAKRRGQIITTDPSTGIMEAMRLLVYHGITCLPVLNEEGELIGIVSDKDIYRTVVENQGDFNRFNVGDVMTRDLIVGLAEDDLEYIAGLMTENRIRHIPVVEGSRLVGLISGGDIVKTQVREAQHEVRYLKQYIRGTYPA